MKRKLFGFFLSFLFILTSVFSVFLYDAKHFNPIFPCFAVFLALLIILFFAKRRKFGLWLGIDLIFVGLLSVTFYLLAPILPLKNSFESFGLFGVISTAAAFIFCIIYSVERRDKEK